MRAKMASIPFSKLSTVDPAESELRSETRLISSVIAGETQAFQELVRPYEGLVYQISYRILRNQADAEDAVQETLLNAYRNLARFRFQAKFSTWLCSIAMNAARGCLRRRNSQGVLPWEGFSSELPTPDTDPMRSRRLTPLEIVEFQELRQNLYHSIAKLPAIYREVFVLRVIEEQNVSTTATNIQSSNAVVKVRLHRARRMLRAHLTAHLMQSARRHLSR